MFILVTGAFGMLGTAVQNVFGNDYRYKVIATNSINLDVRNYFQVMSYLKKDIDFILHLAAETDHIASEFNPADAYFTNVVGTQNMVELAKKKDIPILYMSTGGVFDGNKKVYIETDIPNPINHYSRSKFYGEQIVSRYKKHFIVRAGWMMGGGPEKDKKFINKIFQQIKAGVKEIHAVSDVSGTPTYTYDLAEGIKKYLCVENNHLWGTYNICNRGHASRYEVAKAFVKYLGAKDVKVIPEKTDAFHKANPLTCLYTRTEALKMTLLPELRPWEEGLRDYTDKDYRLCYLAF